MKIVSILLLSLVFYMFKPAPVFSQTTASGFALSPPFIEVALKKEASQSSYIIELANHTASHQNFHLSVVDFGSLDESGGVAFLGTGGKLERKYSLASWVSLEKNVLEIESGTSQKIKVTLVNKESLSPGGHYAAVVATLNPQKDGVKTISLNSALASLIFVKKIGGEIYQLNLVGKEIRSKPLGLPHEIALRFQNSGNVHVAARGTIQVTDPRKKVISKGVINQESALILPESFRVFPTKLERLGLPFLPGNYTLTISYRYDGKANFEEIASSFFYPGILGIAGIIIATVFSIIIITRKKK